MLYFTQALIYLIIIGIVFVVSLADSVFISNYNNLIRNHKLPSQRRLYILKILSIAPTIRYWHLKTKIKMLTAGELRKQGKNNEAIAIYQSLCKRLKGRASIDARVKLADTLATLGQVKESYKTKRILQNELNEIANNPIGKMTTREWYLLGDIQTRNMDFAGAYKSYDNALTIGESGAEPDQVDGIV